MSGRKVFLLGRGPWSSLGAGLDRACSAMPKSWLVLKMHRHQRADLFHCTVAWLHFSVNKYLLSLCLQHHGFTVGGRLHFSTSFSLIH